MDTNSFCDSGVYFRLMAKVTSLSIDRIHRIMDEDIFINSSDRSAGKVFSYLRLKIGDNFELSFNGPERATEPQAVLALKEFFQRLVAACSEHLDETIEETKQLESGVKEESFK